MLEYVIGADPELFLVDKKGNFKSAHAIIPGSKQEPFPVLCGAIQPDGVAAEFNIIPARTAEEFSQNIREVLKELAARTEEKGLSLFVTPTAMFDMKYFKNLPKAAKRLGCEPDFNIYTGTVNPPPATKKPMRTGGGHIHIGWTEGASVVDEAHLVDVKKAVQQLDCILYPMSLLWDADEKRRLLYGSIGTYRPKHYGVEYRPLSNMWVSDPDLHKWIFNATIHAMENLDDEMELWHDHFSAEIVKDILENKIEKKLLQSYHDYLVEEYFMPPLPDYYTRQVN